MKILSKGSVHETLDYLFHQARIQAVAEIVQPIHQQLMVVPGHTKIEKIFSHPQALAQGKKFIDEQYPEAQIEITASTAYAAQFLFPNIQTNLMQRLHLEVLLKNMAWN